MTLTGGLDMFGEIAEAQYENEGRFVKSGEGVEGGFVMVLAICGCVC